MSDTYKKKDTAERYDSARELPDEATALWMDKMARLAPVNSIRGILDLGGGTGRFARLLQKVYKCPVIAIDPSAEMLRQGVNRGFDGVTWICGSAEHIPLETGFLDLIWMSQVFHHLEDKVLTFREMDRVLKPEGILAIRNGTRESDAEIIWGQCFPEARKLDEERIPFQADITNFVCEHGFDLVSVQTVYQLFAFSYAEYYDKLSQRGLSSLISTSDEAFNRGLKRLREWITSQPMEQQVYETVDLFVFRKRKQGSAALAKKY